MSRALRRRHVDAMRGRPRPPCNEILTHDDLSRYKVTTDGWEVLRWSFYDSAAYAAAGQATLPFFQNPSPSAGKTLSDGNFLGAGLLPAGNEFLIEQVEVEFYPTIPAVAGFNPFSFGAALGASAGPINDVYQFRRGGNITIQIASQKSYLQEAPLAQLPSRVHYHVEGALSDTTTAGASQQTRIMYADVYGEPYTMKPYAILLEPMQLITLSLNWPEGVIALPSGNPAKVYVRLRGLYFRRDQ